MFTNFFFYCHCYSLPLFCRLLPDLIADWNSAIPVFFNFEFIAFKTKDLCVTSASLIVLSSCIDKFITMCLVAGLVILKQLCSFLKSVNIFFNVFCAYLYRKMLFFVILIALKLTGIHNKLWIWFGFRYYCHLLLCTLLYIFSSKFKRHLFRLYDLLYNLFLCTTVDMLLNVKVFLNCSFLYLKLAKWNIFVYNQLVKQHK